MVGGSSWHFHQCRHRGLSEKRCVARVGSCLHPFNGFTRTLLSPLLMLIAFVAELRAQGVRPDSVGGCFDAGSVRTRHVLVKVRRGLRACLGRSSNSMVAFWAAPLPTSPRGCGSQISWSRARVSRRGCRLVVGERDLSDVADPAKLKSDPCRVLPTPWLASASPALRLAAS